MNFVLLLPSILCCLVMVAHFLRAWTGDAAFGPTLQSHWDLFMIAMGLTLPFLLMVQTRYVLRTFQALLILAAIQWVFIAIDLIHDRLAQHNPDLIAPTIILASVALFNLLAAALFQSRRLQRLYPAEPHRHAAP